jgi:hypothetical protein
MTDAERRMAGAYERGLRDGFETLSAVDQDLYLIQDFVFEYQLGDLTGYFYNRLQDREGIHRTIDVMRRRGLGELASLLEEAAFLFRNYAESHTQTTWGDVLKQYDPEERLMSVSDRIRRLGNFGLAAMIME